MHWNALEIAIVCCSNVFMYKNNFRRVTALFINLFGIYLRMDIVCSHMIDLFWNHLCHTNLRPLFYSNHLCTSDAHTKSPFLQRIFHIIDKIHVRGWHRPLTYDSVNGTFKISRLNHLDFQTQSIPNPRNYRPDQRAPKTNSYHWHWALERLLLCECRGRHCRDYIFVWCSASLQVSSPHHPQV